MLHDRNRRAQAPYATPSMEAHNLYYRHNGQQLLPTPVAMTSVLSHMITMVIVFDYLRNISLNSPLSLTLLGLVGDTSYTVRYSIFIQALGDSWKMLTVASMNPSSGMLALPRWTTMPIPTVLDATSAQSTGLARNARWHRFWRSIRNSATFAFALVLRHIPYRPER